MEETLPRTDRGQDDAVATFLKNQHLLYYIATAWYRVPESEVEPYVQEIFMTYLERRAQIRNLRLWMIGAMIRSCRLYWDQRKHLRPLPPDIENRPDPSFATIEEEIVNRLTIAKALSKTPDRCRALLASRFLDGSTLHEIAGAEKTTAKYAKKLVYGCLKKFRRLYFEMTRV